jgi:hypothetical protein
MPHRNTPPNSHSGRSRMERRLARNTDNKTYLSAFCTADLGRKLDIYAQDMGWSRSEALRILIHDGLARHELGIGGRLVVELDDDAAMLGRVP